MDASELGQRRRRAHFRAKHRGTKEMDWLLGRFADERVAQMASAQLMGFEVLLEMSDTELHAWLMEPSGMPEAAERALIDEIRAFHGLDDA